MRMLGTADPQGVTSVTLGSRAITFSGEKPFFSAQKALAQLPLRLAATGHGPLILLKPDFKSFQLLADKESYGDPPDPIIGWM